MLQRLFAALLALLLSRQLRRFVVVGLCSAITDFSVFNIALAYLGPSAWHAVIANTLSFTAGTCVGYTLNSRYTFSAERSRTSAARYLAVAVIGVAIYDTGLFLLLLKLDASSTLMTNAAKVFAVAPSATWNFIGFSLFAFGGARAGTGAGAATPATRPLAAGIATETIDGRR